MAKRPKVEPIRQPTLFQMEKLDQAVEPGELKIERPYSLPGILLGTSAFTADGWQGSFYPIFVRRGSVARPASMSCGHIADGTVQADGVAMIHVGVNQAQTIFYGGRSAQPDALRL